MKENEQVLIVDDEHGIRRLLKRILEKDGYTVIEAENGYKALDIMESTSPSIVLLDYMMPGLNGFQVLGRIRKRYDIPVIMLTAKKEEAILDGAFDIGADDYVTKPFGSNELLARIRAKLRRRQTGTVPHTKS